MNKIYIALISTLFILNSCSSSVSNKPVIFKRSGEYNVEVSSQGSKVDYSNKLVFRQSFNIEQINEIQRVIKEAKVGIYSFSDVIEYGKKMPGFKVRKVGRFATENNLLLRRNDILLSIGATHVENIPKYNILNFIFNELENNEKVSLSILRSGLYKKIIYLKE